MKEVILIKNGELALKGLNKKTFEDMLAKNIRRAVQDFGGAKVTCAQSTMQVQMNDENLPLDEVADRISKVFGIAKLSRACIVEKDMEVILPAAAEYLADVLESAMTFKVEAKRSDKKFPLKSPEICAKTGEYLLEKFPHLTVDVHDPDVTVYIEIRDVHTYIHTDPVNGAGGLPVGSSGKAAILISGGIDSPVAAWMMAKRGLSLNAIHFASPPYTSQRAEEKVIELLRRVSKYSSAIKLHIVPFTTIQEKIKDYCAEEYFTIIMRRYMMRIAQIIAKNENCPALITGESVGQVASQTLKAIACTDCVAEMPVFRPVIGMDKDEIIQIARKIDTFEISVLPYEDCCTVFTPKHPRTRPELDAVIKEEEKLSIEQEIEDAISNIRTIIVE